MKEYNPQLFWKERGKEPAEPFSVQKKIKILEALSNLKFNSVLEIGCGDGQLTDIITRYFKPSRYLAIDLSNERLANIKGDVEKKQADILSFATDEKFDLVIASHTLLHIQPPNIRKVLEKMYHYAKKYIIHIDPIDFSIKGSWAYYNFPHSYWDLWREITDSYQFKQIEPNVGLWMIEK